MRVPDIAVTCGLLSTTASVSAQELDPILNMCIRFDHQSVVKNSTLYIDGGKETFIDVERNGSSVRQIGTITEGYNTYLVAIDLSQSWDWKSNISEKALPKTHDARTGTASPVLSRGALFYGSDNDSNIYLWGGTTSYWNTSFPGFEAPTPQQYSLWSFDTATQGWDQYDLTLGSANRPSSGSFTNAENLGLGFYFNGELDSGSEIQTQSYGDGVKQLIGGMIVVDLVNQTARNLSTQAVSSDVPRSRGSMMYIRDIGSHGIIVQIGGNYQNVTNTTGITSPDIENLLPMDEIDIFDVASYYNASTPDGTWYKQKTSGDIPDPRIDFCLTLASAPDGSSHNVYLYGGRGAGAFFDEVWVLSIPSFTWTKVYQGEGPRFGHTCHRAGNRTMITVGGAANDDWHGPPCDFETKGVGVFDLSDLVWGSVYDASAPAYAVPTPIAARIGGSPSGGATMSEPIPSGFDQPGLADIFEVQYQGPPAGSTPTPTPGSSGPRPNYRTAVIAGCAVGGMACITLAAGLGFRYRKRIRHRLTGRESPCQEMDNQEELFHEMDGQKSVLQEMDSPARAVQELDNHQTFVPELGARNICWELPAEPAPAARSGGRSGSGAGPFRRSGIPVTETAPEVPRPGETGERSPGASQRSVKMLPPLPVPRRGRGPTVLEAPPQGTPSS